MDQAQKSVDGILQALSPVLAEEFARAVQAALRAQEEAFQNRLDAAVREVEQTTLNSAASRHDQSLHEAREEAQREAEARFQAQSRDAVDQALAQATARFEEERANLQNELRMWRTYAEAQRELNGSASQTEMLARFLDFAGPFAESLAIYVMRSDGLALWKTSGTTVFPHVVSANTIDPEWYFSPVVVRGRTVAAICAQLPYKTEPLDFLRTSLRCAIEAFGMRLQVPVLQGSATT